MVADISFTGYGVFTELGFSTDVSETCQWITPFVKEPADTQDFL